MRKLMISLMTVAIVAMTMAVQAATFRPLTLEEQSNLGATHAYELTYADLAASTSTNTALVLSNITLRSGQSVQCVAMILTTAFDTGNTNYTGSLAMTVGDSSDDDLFLTSTELASDGSEVLIKVGRNDVHTITVSSVLSTNEIIYLNASTNAATNTLIYVSAKPTATASAGIGGAKLYSATNYIKVTLTPNAEEALSANTSGAVRILFRIL